MKFFMRETFANPYHIVNSYDEVFQLEDHSIVVSLAMPNFFQDSEQTQEDKDDVKQNEELTTSCANSKSSSHTAPITRAENMNIGNAYGATLTEGENSLDVLTFSTNHAMMEQVLVESYLNLPLSQDDLLDVPCDKDNVCDDTYVYWNQILVLKIDIFFTLLVMLMS